MIHVENLTKEYDAPTSKGHPILAADALNLDIPAGEILGMVGPNGAGGCARLRQVKNPSVCSNSRVAEKRETMLVQL